MSHSTTLQTHILGYYDDPEIHVYRFEEDGHDYIVLSILRDLGPVSSTGGESLRIKMPVAIFEEIMAKGGEVLQP